VETVPRHQCIVYAGSPARYLPGLAAIIVQRLQAGRRCLYLNSPAMVAGMRSYLAAAGLDVAQAVKKGALVLSSDESHLNDGHFDAQRMLDMLEEAISRALKDGYEGLWATGDMTWEFGREANFSKLLEYERGLEELFQKHPALSGICQYHTETLPAHVVEQGLRAHPAVYLNETLSRINPYYQPNGAGNREQPHASRMELQHMLHQLGQPVDS
jgi:hypothetical protein